MQTEFYKKRRKKLLRGFVDLSNNGNVCMKKTTPKLCVDNMDCWYHIGKVWFLIQEIQHMKHQAHQNKDFGHRVGPQFCSFKSCIFAMEIFMRNLIWRRHTLVHCVIVHKNLFKWQWIVMKAIWCCYVLGWRVFQTHLIGESFVKANFCANWSTLSSNSSGIFMSLRKVCGHPLSLH